MNTSTITSGRLIYVYITWVILSIWTRPTITSGRLIYVYIAWVILSIWTRHTVTSFTLTSTQDAAGSSWLTAERFGSHQLVEQQILHSIATPICKITSCTPSPLQAAKLHPALYGHSNLQNYILHSIATPICRSTSCTLSPLQSAEGHPALYRHSNLQEDILHSIATPICRRTSHMLQLIACLLAPLLS